MPMAERIERLEAWAPTLREHHDELVALAISAAGSTHKWATGQVETSARIMETMPRRATLLADEAVAGLPDAAVVSEPYGVLGLVTPGNSPYRALLLPIAEALLAGNTVVVRPSSATMPAARRILELVSQHWPGVIELTDAPGPVVSAAFATSQKIAAVRVFGSFRTGQQFLTRYGEALAESVQGTADLGRLRRLKTFVLELSGNDPLIVLPGADLAAAAGATVAGSFLNSGQVCLCAKRIIVHREVYEPFVEHLLAGVARLVVGPAEDPATDIGPLIKPQAVKAVREQLEDARAYGGEILCGGGVDGATVEPTIIRFATELLAGDSADKPALWRKECFGPVRALAVVDSREQALAFGEDTPNGLGATVYGNPEDSQWIAERLRAGRIVVNRSPSELLGKMVPFGGVKDSGLSGAEYPIRAVTYRKLIVGGKAKG